MLFSMDCGEDEVFFRWVMGFLQVEEMVVVDCVWARKRKYHWVIGVESGRR